MCKILNLHQFEKEYCFSEHRKHLFACLISELQNIICQCSRCRFVIFGSYLKKKQAPGDIDLILSVIPDKNHSYPILKNGLKRACPDEIDLQYSVNQMLVPPPEKLVDTFQKNPLNKKKKIKVINYIELDASDLESYLS